MKLIAKKTDENGNMHIITVLSSKNKIAVNRHGMVIITRGNHYSADKIRHDILADFYEIPEGVTIDD